jgi:hypothetical protein
LRNITQSTCTVIPPHMMRHVAAHGDDHQRERVRSTLSQTAQLAYGRASNTLIGASTERTAQKNRRVYDAGHHQILPGKLVMTEQRPAGTDIEAKEAFEGSGATYDFFAQVFRRNSIDARGMRLDSTVHYGTRFDNAMWNGRQMVYGDGDGTLFNRFTVALDVIGHELTHGITQHTARLEYQGQSGALNEHLSDAFGIMVKQYRLGTTSARSDWLIGAGLLGKDVRGVAVRSMKAPGTAYDDPVLGKDPQPSHMRHYVDGADDNGGVHINSGIPNRAFYLAAFALRGFSWRVAGNIWYVVLTTKLFPKAGFQDFANATVSTAGELYAFGGNEQRAIVDAWSAVGIDVPASLTRAEGQRPLPPGSPANVIVNLQSSTLQPPRDARQKDEFFSMSTGQQHHTEHNTLTFDAINAHVNSIDLSKVTAPPAAAQTAEDREQRLQTAYTAARPILVAVAAIPFIPANWRAIVSVLVAALDQVTASFKAGKDLAVSDGGGAPISTMEPKLPA